MVRETHFNSAVLGLLVSERSERDTLRGNKWKSEIFIYIYIYMVRETHFSSAVPGYVMWEELSVRHF